MDAIELLMSEHRLIEAACDALASFADAQGRSNGSGGAELARFVTFIREFADAAHHAKEEDILFEAMIAAGFPREAGPVAVMRAEHDQGRALVGILDGISRLRSWSDPDRARLSDAAHGYADLLRAHIEKEDSILYPMAEARLPPAVQEQVDRDCAAFEQRRPSDALRRLGEELVAAHGQPRAGAHA